MSRKNPGEYSITFYPTIALLLKKIETFLNEHDPALTRQERNNLRFYLLRRAIIRAVKSLRPSPNDIAKIQLDAVTPELLKKSFDELQKEYLRLGGDDQVAKGVDLAKFVNETRF